MCENTKDCCRICLDEDLDHVSILDDSTIQLQIKSCLAMTVSGNDSLPKNICTSCVSQLNDFYNFQLNARCSLDWLEYNVENQAKKSSEVKLPIQPLPDCEYNSDSLLEFLNNTANIEEYLNNLGKEDIPTIASMLDRHQENSLDTTAKVTNVVGKTKQPSPKKKDVVKTKSCIKMEIDVLDSDVEVVKKIIMKEIGPKKTSQAKDKNCFTCFACKTKLDCLNKLSQHLSICDPALRTCIHCNLLFDSKIKMQQHSVIHNENTTRDCGKKLPTKGKQAQNHQTSQLDNTALMGYMYRCKLCKETFLERFNLYKHAKQHVLQMEKKICDICGQILMGVEAFTKHKKDVHGSEDSLYRCKICRYTSRDRKDIYLHVQNHIATPKPEDSHLCDSCGKSFTTRSALLRHALQHMPEHKCNICKKEFGDAKSRDDHVQGHVETVICEKCGANVSSYKLEVHSCM